MVPLFIVLIILTCLAIGFQIYWIWTSPRAPREGKFLERKGKTTMFNVRQLLVDGNKESAIKMYCEIFDVPHKQAQKDIEELERSLKA